jgi:hypothetical protein
VGQAFQGDCLVLDKQPLLEAKFPNIGGKWAPDMGATMLWFLVGTWFLGFLTIAGTAYMIGGYGPHPKTAVCLWVAAFIWLLGAPIAYWEYQSSKRKDVGVLVVHRTVMDRLLFRYHPLDAFADRMFEIGSSGTKFVMLDNGSIHEFFTFMKLALQKENNRLIVTARILDKEGNIIATVENGGEWHAIEPKIVDFNYTDDLLEVKGADGRVALQLRPGSRANPRRIVGTNKDRYARNQDCAAGRCQIWRGLLPTSLDAD